MHALILNSGTGSRLGDLTKKHPKCMTKISGDETILSRQLRQLEQLGIAEIIITTGPFEELLKEYVDSLDVKINIMYITNPLYRETNYIYSIYCAGEYLNDEIILLHGDLVFETDILKEMIDCEYSCMAVESGLPLPEKDFKAVVIEGYITKVGIDFFEDAVAAQPLYKLLWNDWKLWLDKIKDFCENDNRNCYAENAFNEISKQCRLQPFDVKGRLCSEIDNLEDLQVVSARIEELEDSTVYMCLSTDVVHSGHINIIRKAAKLGKLIIGVLSDEAVISYKRYPLMPFDERRALFENIVGVYKVVEQEKLSYRENLLKYKPMYVVHGDDWKTGFQKPIRDEVISVLETYGGKLVEYPYSNDPKYRKIDERARAELSLPDIRRARLKKTMEMKGLVTVLEAHSGITGLIVENTIVYQNGEAHQFDAMWISSLCDSTAKGKPDIELVDMSSRLKTIDEIMEVTTKPIIFDGDTGGLTEHFVYTVQTLERIGVSMVIIEDKVGLKKNSLFGTEVEQTQDTIENFCAKIAAGKKAKKTKDFMIVARIESLILEQGMEDALKRAFAYVQAGADGIMIHSRRKEADEIFTFVEGFRKEDKITPIVVVPTSYNTVTEEELKNKGVNVVIYANQLTRSGFPAMENAAKTILENHRAKECDDMCMSIKDIITLIPEAVQ